jgi:hypothetical protein
MPVSDNIIGSKLIHIISIIVKLVATSRTGEFLV